MGVHNLQPCTKIESHHRSFRVTRSEAPVPIQGRPDITRGRYVEACDKVRRVVIGALRPGGRHWALSLRLSLERLFQGVHFHKVLCIIKDEQFW